MPDLNRLEAIALLFCAALPLAACDGTSAVFNPPTDEPGPEPPSMPPAIAVQQVFTQVAFEQPLLMLQAPGDATRWFVVERPGAVRIFPNDPDASLADVETFIDLETSVDSGPGEAGLLGMAFHPDFATNGQVFLSYTRTNAGLESVVSRFTVGDAGTLDPGTEEVLLTVPQRFGNHNGGNIVFGPDGFLYIGFGDGGGAGDPDENAQDTSNLLGSIVRIDVEGTGGYAIPADNPFAGNTECRQGFSSAGNLDCPEIFAWGFRNPWRFSFDSRTGELWAGDVGQNSWEEVDRVEMSENYGWDEREGAHCFEPPESCSTANVDPVTEYANAGDDSSVTGGYVYRGSAIPGLVDFYVFGDFGSGRIRAIPADSEQGVEPDELVDTGLAIASFAEDDAGELYVIDVSAGTIHRIVEL
ncbi:MAG TPA: PQQ-dependent sugar dehydrogenase [Woeseiaceae bacterium]|nr:PQQ-dependent sugar dehydrogenase [Woeseiaceae bacterium]